MRRSAICPSDMVDLESRRGSCRAPVFLPSCFPDSHSDLCFHQSQRGPAPAASHTTSDRPRRGPGV